MPLADLDCTVCWGMGFKVSSRIDNTLVCRCVYRHIFRSCYARYKEASDPGAWSDRPLAWGEYLADFTSIAKRTLGAAHYRLFKMHFLEGATMAGSARSLGMDRKQFYRASYKVQELLGAAYGSASPCALFPLDEYFTPSRRVRG
jgi:hypothetical protein